VRGSMEGTSSSGIPGNSARQHCLVSSCNTVVPVKKLPVAQLYKNILECYWIHKRLFSAEQVRYTTSHPNRFKIHINIIPRIAVAICFSDLPLFW
jgi:hypothetical protein